MEIIFKQDHVIQGGEFNGIYKSGEVKEFPEDLAKYLIEIGVAVES